MSRASETFSQDILNLWKEGFTASQIKHKLQLKCGRNYVSTVICRARKRHDQRAVTHRYASGRIVGRERR
jgi:hypothetical protein